MIFFKNSLITFIILSVAISVIPVTSNKADVERLCKKILKNLNEYKGTIISLIFNSLTCRPDKANVSEINTFNEFKEWIEPLKTTQLEISDMFILLKLKMPIPEAECDSEGELIPVVPIKPAKDNSKEKIIEVAFKLLEKQRNSGKTIDKFCAGENLRDLFV